MVKKKYFDRRFWVVYTKNAILRTFFGQNRPNFDTKKYRVDRHSWGDPRMPTLLQECLLFFRNFYFHTESREIKEVQIGCFSKQKNTLL